MSNDTPKINIASYRVLQTLMCLFEKNMTMQEIIDAMVQKVDKGYNNFVASKYINTCKSCGIDIQKIDGKYTLVNMPFGVKFSPDEAKLLYDLKLYTESLKNNKTEKLFKDLLNKLHLSFYKSNAGLKSSVNYNVIRLFEKAYYAKCKITIIFKDDKKMECIPKSLKVVNGKILFTTQNSLGTQEIDPIDVIDIKFMEENVPKQIPKEGVIFELYGKLAKRYQMRENEQLVKLTPKGSLVISNKYEDKDELLRRLMRYDSSCRIVKPASYVEDMKKLINETLDNYK